MYPVSNEYLEAMNKTTRDASQMEISLDLVNTEAQNLSQWSNHSSTPSWANFPIRYPTELPQREFATFEKDYIRADGKQYIFKTPPVAPLPNNNGGFESLWLADENCNLLNNNTYPFVEVSFSTPVNSLDALTLYFDIFDKSKFVTNLEVWSYTNDVITVIERTNNSAIAILRDLNLQNINKLRIVMKTMNRPHVRARLWEMKFGEVLTFANNELLSVSIKDEIDPTSSSLPDKSIVFTIDNSDKRFDFENPDGIYEKLLEEQRITAKIGIKTIYGDELLPLGIYYLSEWNIPRNKAEFKGISSINFRNIQSLYYWYIGEINSAGISNSTFALNGYSLLRLLWSIIWQKGGNVDINNVSEDLTTFRPLPVDSKLNDTMQMIAQALGFTLSTNKVTGDIKFYQLRQEDMKYQLNYDNSQIADLKLSPKLKNIKVKVYKYELDDTSNEIYKWNVKSTGAGGFSNTISSDYIVGATYSVAVKSGSYSNPSIYVYPDVSQINMFVNLSANSEIEFTIKARKVNLKEEVYEVQISDTGEELFIDNPFCTSIEIARRIADNYEYWYKQRKNYEVEYRGEPALECGDNITLQTQFSDSVSVNLISNSYDWENGAIKNAKAGLKVGGL